MGGKGGREEREGEREERGIVECQADRVTLPRDNRQVQRALEKSIA